jgi:hypothetical protein
LRVKPGTWGLEMPRVSVLVMREETEDETHAREIREKKDEEKKAKRIAVARKADLAKAKALLEKHNVKWISTGAE